MRVEEDLMLQKTPVKSKKKKKNKTGDFQGAASDTETDVRSDSEAVGMKDIEAAGDLHMEKGQKRKKKKIKPSEVCMAEVNVSANTTEGDKKRRSKKLDEAYEEGSLEVDDNVQKEEKHRKKKRKVNISEDKDASIENSHVGEKILQTGDTLDAGNDSELKHRKEKKKRNVEQRKKDKTTPESSSMGRLEGEEMRSDEIVELNKSSEKVNTKKSNCEEFAKNGETGRGNTIDKITEIRGKKKTQDEKGVGESVEFPVGENIENAEKKKRKREKRKENNDLGAGLREIGTEKSGKEGSILQEKDFVNGVTNGQSTSRNRKDNEDNKSSKGKKKRNKALANGSEDPQPKGKSKKVSFSNEVEVFPSVVQGKRFSQQEDEIVKEAVLNYIKVHDLGEAGLDMVLHCKAHPEIKNCWREIGAAIPYRPYSAVYYRAHILFERDEKRKWTEEDYEFVRKAQKQHGNDWKLIAEELGKHRIHVKDTWRRIKFQNRKKGNWSQEEYQTLYDMVNIDLQLKLNSEEKMSKHGMLRDNIPWSAISEKVSTRSDAHCCSKWYKQLTSSMVAEGIWADADDYRLIGALYDLDPSCEGDVDWDNLLDHRSGDVCRKRWNQMVLHIGYHGSKPFAEQVETLAKRYRPDLAEAREVWDSKPVTD